MEIKVTISNQEEKIASAIIKNGRWTYSEKYLEEPIKLTINNVFQTDLLQMPVRDAYGYIDNTLYKKTGKIQIKKADVRKYHTLLDFLNYRINNVKEEYKSKTYDLLFKDTGHTFNAVLFEDEYDKSNDITKEIVNNKIMAIEVNIAIIE